MKDSMTSASQGCLQRVCIWVCRCSVFHLVNSGTQRWAFGQCFSFLSIHFIAYLDWCEEVSSKTSWFYILCPDCTLSHLSSFQRSKALRVWLSSPHYLPFCSRPWPTRAVPYSSILCLSFSDPNINTAHIVPNSQNQSHISNSFWICCPFFAFFIYIDSFPI